MSIFETPVGYQQRYVAARALAVAWPLERLVTRLAAMLNQDMILEKDWGPIDALTDILGGIEVPTWER
jgi:hypothetical protein